MLEKDIIMFSIVFDQNVKVLKLKYYGLLFVQIR